VRLAALTWGWTAAVMLLIMEIFPELKIPPDSFKPQALLASRFFTQVPIWSSPPPNGLPPCTISY